MSFREQIIGAYFSAKGIPALRTYREFVERGRWSAERLVEWSAQRLAASLEHACATVPFYRDLGCTPELASFPALSKRELQDRFEDLFAEGLARDGSWKCDTSGSTGQRVYVQVDMPERLSRIGATWRGDCFGGFGLGDRYIKLWGVSPKGGKTRQALVNLTNKLISGQTMLGTLSMDKARVREIHAYLLRERPRIISGFTSSLAAFAQSCLEQRLGVVDCGKVIATAENLDPSARERITAVFSGPIMQRYGCREAGDIAHQCEQGSWHINSDHVHLEVLKADGSISPEGTGSLLITKLSNRLMPLVRYAVGDTVTLGGEPCACGRPLPVMHALHGRDVTMLKLPSGRLASGHLGGLPPWHKPIRQWQIERTGPDTATYRYVPLPELSAEQELALQSELEALFSHELRLSYERCDSIAPAASGKHMPVISPLDGLGSGAGPA